ncbi:hypothetical protein IAT38_007913 [Cryptococcus sp. DSM 104549]
MSVSQETFQSLKDMGIEPVLAREAASRYHNIEPAVNWCFGDGQNWRPEPVRQPDLPAYDRFNPRHSVGTSIEHREVIEIDDDEPTPSPPSRSPHIPSTIPLGSNNPFLQPVPRSPRPQPPLPPRPTSQRLPPAPLLSQTVDDLDQADEDLRKAIMLSEADIGAGGAGEPMDEDDNRAQRERSVRATGPPPPSPSKSDDAMMGTLFGPSNKSDEKGEMAMVPSGQKYNKEEEDLDKAIQESLMTASFHSASNAPPVEQVERVVREEGAPLVFHSESSRYSLVASYLQALSAIPRFRDFVCNTFKPIHGSSSKLDVLGALFQQTWQDPHTFIHIDDAIRQLAWEARGQLPPQNFVLDIHLNVMRDIETLFLEVLQKSGEEDPVTRTDDSGHRLFGSEINTGSDTFISDHVVFPRQGSLLDAYSLLSHVLWGSESSSQSIDDPSDILVVMVKWDPGAVKELWKLDETVVLDRFLSKNAAYAANMRGLQAVSAGNMRRTQEKIDQLTQHNGNNYLDSIASLIAHINLSPIPDDTEKAKAQEEMKSKLQFTLDLLKERVTALEQELEGYKKAASGGVFDTDDPQLKQHVYGLRSILWFDGLIFGQNHIYSYCKGDDGRWWKIQEHETTQVDWQTIATDKTGLYMEGGPCMLVYDRESPRPTSPSPPPTSLPESTEHGQPTHSYFPECPDSERQIPEGDLLGLSTPSLAERSSSTGDAVRADKPAEKVAATVSEGAFVDVTIPEPSPEIPLTANGGLGLSTSEREGKGEQAASEVKAEQTEVGHVENVEKETPDQDGQKDEDTIML